MNTTHITILHADTKADIDTQTTALVAGWERAADQGEFAMVSIDIRTKFDGIRWTATVWVEHTEQAMEAVG